MEPKTAIEKLQLLLPHWIEHNLNHGIEFERWSASARAEGADGLAALLKDAAAAMAATDALLKKALAEIGGPAEGHSHAHPHKHGA